MAKIKDIEFYNFRNFKHLKNSFDKNVNILGDGNPKIGAHNKPVVFLHPNDLSGTLVELEET